MKILVKADKRILSSKFLLSMMERMFQNLRVVEIVTTSPRIREIVTNRQGWGLVDVPDVTSALLFVVKGCVHGEAQVRVCTDLFGASRVMVVTVELPFKMALAEAARGLFFEMDPASSTMKSRMFEVGGVTYKILQQNPKKDSVYAQAAKDGLCIAWVFGPKGYTGDVAWRLPGCDLQVGKKEELRGLLASRIGGENFPIG